MFEKTGKKRVSRFTPLQQRILGFIAERSVYSGGEASCTKREIAQAVNCSLKTVDRAIACLRAEEVIESYPRFGMNGKQEGNGYRIVSHKQETFV